MSYLGKLTHLLWGYSIVDKGGKIFSKFKFLTKHNNDARKILDALYDKFHTYNDSQAQAYRENYLKDNVQSLTGFNVVRT